MDNTMLNSILIMWSELMVVIANYIPRVLVAIVVMIVGVMLARFFKHFVIRVLEKFRLSSALKKTPVQHFVENDEVGVKVESGIGVLVYWLVVLAVIHTVLSILGLTTLSIVLEKIFSFIPKILSAIVVLFFGVLLAGFVESFTKGLIKSIDGNSARLFGKISSYLVMIVSVLAAISELGIAENFILVLFIGFIGTITLGLGLAIGLGGQHLVRQSLESWFQRTKKEIDVE